MEVSDIRALRLLNQQLTNPKLKTVPELVRYLGAVQSQDYQMAKWAIGVRIPDMTDKDVEQAINSGEIIRTHVLRPTWHFVAVDDIRWMLELTAPQINVTASSNYRKLELTTEAFNRSNTVLEKALQGGKQLTRAELVGELKKAGINTDGLRASHFMFRAELDRVICNGSLRNKQFTYALFDEKVPPGKTRPREEALAELAIRYFTSRGPATIDDFAWWSGLSKTDAKAGLESVKSALLSEKFENSVYWFANPGQTIAGDTDNIHFLPAFDEFMVSYKDRSVSINPKIPKEISGSGIFKPVIVINGETVGTWKRTFTKKDIAEVEIIFFKSVPTSARKKILGRLNAFSCFTGREVVIV